MSIARPILPHLNWQAFPMLCLLGSRIFHKEGRRLELKDTANLLLRVAGSGIGFPAGAAGSARTTLEPLPPATLARVSLPCLLLLLSTLFSFPSPPPPPPPPFFSLSPKRRDRPHKLMREQETYLGARLEPGGSKTSQELTWD